MDEYNVAFEQAATNLAAEITDEPVKIDKYRSGLQPELREMCRTSPTGNRWANLGDLAAVCHSQWPTVEERLEAQVVPAAKSVAGKRKASGGGSGKTSKARLSAALTDEQYAHNMANRLCHKCGKPDHIASRLSGGVSGQRQEWQGKQKKGRKDFQKR